MEKHAFGQLPGGRLLRTAILLPVVLFSLLGCGASSTPEEHLKKAAEYQQAGDFKEAIIELKNALKQAPEHAEARWALGNIYLKTGDAESAIKELSKAVELGIKKAESDYPLVRAYLLKGRYQDALKQLPETTATSDVALALRGQAYVGLNEIGKGREEFEKALQKNPKSREALLGITRVHQLGGDLEQALASIDKALVEEPGLSRAWLIKGEILFAQGGSDAALEAFKKAGEDKNLRPLALLGSSRVHIAKQDFAAAEPELKEILAAIPGHPLANYLQAVVHSQKQDLDAASLALQEVFKSSPDFPPALLLMGSINYQQNKLEQAQKNLSRLVGARPDHVPGRKLLASTLIKLGQPAQAVETLLPAVDETTEDAELVAQLGGAYLAAGDVEKGSSYIERAATLAPDSAKIQTQLAITHLRSGQTDAAVNELEVAVALDNPPELAEILLISQRMRNGDHEGALRGATALVEKQPDNPMGYNLQGAAYLQLKKVDEAEKAYASALKIKPDYHPATLNLAAIALTKGDKALARKHYETILSFDKSHEQALIALAKLESEAGQIDKVLELLEQARAGNPHALQARLLLANHYLGAGNIETARAVINEAKAAYPESPFVLLLHARIAAAAGDRPGAVATLESFLGRYPKSLPFLLQLGLLRMQAGELDLARKALRQALEVDPKHLSALAGLFQVERADQKFAVAEELANRMIELQPTSGQGFIMLGDLYGQQGDQAKASEQYKKGAALSPSSLATAKLFEAEKARGNLADGQRILLDWLKQHPDDQQIGLAYAASQQEAGKVDEAEQAYRKLLEKSPDNVTVLNNLAWLYHERGDDKPAMELSEKAFRLAPGRGEVVDTYGSILLKTDAKQALTHLQEAAKLMPDSGDVQFHLAQALAANGKAPEALKILRSILAPDAPEFAGKSAAAELLGSLQ